MRRGGGTMENTVIKLEDIAPNNHNLELKEIFKRNYEDFWWELLTYLELSFPHAKGDNSDNEKRFNVIRSRILRLGNNKVRDLEKIFQSYVVLQLTEFKLVANKDIQKEIFDFKNKFSIN